MLKSVAHAEELDLHVQLDIPKLVIHDAEEQEGEEVSFDDIVYHPIKSSTKKTSPKPPSSEEFVCKEACCAKFCRDFKCRSEYDRHAESTHHKTAVIFGAALRTHVSSSDALDAEEEAIRGLVCNAEACPDYDQRFPSLNTYLNHMTKPQHQDGAEPDVRAALVEAVDKADLKLTCRKAGCPKQGTTFLTVCGYRLHLGSRSHAEAQEPSTPLMPTSSMVAEGGASFTTPLFSPITPSVTVGQSSPSSPSVGRDSAGVRKGRKRKSVLPRFGTSRQRDEELARRNEELEARVKKLEDELAGVRPLLESVKMMGFN